MADPVLEINVGGTLFSTRKSTLMKSGYFEALLSRWDPGRQIFVDRNPNTFAIVLDFLRGTEPMTWNETLEREFEYFCLKVQDPNPENQLLCPNPVTPWPDVPGLDIPAPYLAKVDTWIPLEFQKGKTNNKESKALVAQLPPNPCSGLFLQMDIWSLEYNRFLNHEEALELSVLRTLELKVEVILNEFDRDSVTWIDMTLEDMKNRAWIGSLLDQDRKAHGFGMELPLFQFTYDGRILSMIRAGSLDHLTKGKICLCWNPNPAWKIKFKVLQRIPSQKLFQNIVAFMNQEVPCWHHPNHQVMICNQEEQTYSTLCFFNGKARSFWFWIEGPDRKKLRIAWVSCSFRTSEKTILFKTERQILEGMAKEYCQPESPVYNLLQKHEALDCSKFDNMVLSFQVQEKTTGPLALFFSMAVKNFLIYHEGNVSLHFIH